MSTGSPIRSFGMLAVGQEQRVPYGRIPNQRCRRWWRSLEGAQVLEEGGVRLEQERRPQGSGGRSSGDAPMAQVQRMPLGRGRLPQSRQAQHRALDGRARCSLTFVGPFLTIDEYLDRLHIFCNFFSTPSLSPSLSSPSLLSLPQRQVWPSTSSPNGKIHSSSPV